VLPYLVSRRVADCPQLAADSAVWRTPVRNPRAIWPRFVPGLGAIQCTEEDENMAEVLTLIGVVRGPAHGGVRKLRRGHLLPSDPPLTLCFVYGNGTSSTRRLGHMRGKAAALLNNPGMARTLECARFSHGRHNIVGHSVLAARKVHGRYGLWAPPHSESAESYRGRKLPAAKWAPPVGVSGGRKRTRH
jgi:hypothetical protein